MRHAHESILSVYRNSSLELRFCGACRDAFFSDTGVRLQPCTSGDSNLLCSRAADTAPTAAQFCRLLGHIVVPSADDADAMDSYDWSAGEACFDGNPPSDKVHRQLCKAPPKRQRPEDANFFDKASSLQQIAFAIIVAVCMKGVKAAIMYLRMQRRMASSQGGRNVFASGGASYNAEAAAAEAEALKPAEAAAKAAELRRRKQQQLEAFKARQAADQAAVAAAAAVLAGGSKKDS